MSSKMPAFLVAMFAAIHPGYAQTQQTAVPAFFALNTHSDPTKPTDWLRIQNAGPAVKIVVALGDSGGFEGCGPGTCDLVAAQNQFVANHNQGQLVFGYVNSQFGTVNDLFGSSSGTGVNAWWNRYSTQIQGIFIDNGPSFDPSQSTAPETTFQTYYESRYATIHGPPYNASNWQVMVNASGFPGTTQTSQPQGWLLSGCPTCSPPATPGADYVVVWEQAFSQYPDTAFKAIGPGGNLQAPPAWWSTAVNPGKIAHVVCDADETQWSSIVSISRNPLHTCASTGTCLASTFPMVYAFDGNPKGYSRVSCYFEQEVQGILNQTVTSNGTTFCDALNACVDTQTNTTCCGPTRTNCPVPAFATPVCTGGSCDFRCTTGYSRCGSACVNESNDPSHCGACGTICQAPQRGSVICSSSLCVAQCNQAPYTTLCGSACVDVSSDTSNCGACGNSCPSGYQCSSGRCQQPCLWPNIMCNGVCVDGTNSPNCGSCNMRCASNEVCAFDQGAGQYDCTCFSGSSCL